MVVGSRRVADDTETDERHLIEVADLCNGARFHIYRQPFGEVPFDFIQFLAVGDEFVTTTDEASMYRGFRAGDDGQDPGGYDKAVEEEGLRFKVYGLGIKV
mgnify:CR=1 FL=1